MIQKGISFYQEKIVSDTDTAISYDSGNLEVFATPAMVAFMENTAMKCVIEYMEVGYDTVGIEINTKHIKASKVGSCIMCKAVVIDFDGRIINFSIECKEGDNIIGTATHQRFIINRNKFMSKL